MEMSNHPASSRADCAISVDASCDDLFATFLSSTTRAASETGDGFTEDEKRVNTRVSQDADKIWTPQQEYHEMDIADLIPGPGCRTFMGRIVNFCDSPYSTKKPRAAKGCQKIIIKDDTGVVSIRLWYAQPPQTLRLGHLVTVWTTHISLGVNNKLAPLNAPLFASLFPERDRGCHFMLHEASDNGTICKAPLDYRPGRPVSGLMTLQNFMEGGYDVPSAKILVAVKWIGAKKQVKTKRGEVNDVVNVGLFDDTEEASLTLWRSACSSASNWQVSRTVLLITTPGWKAECVPRITLTPNTMVDVNPDIEDAHWMRTFAERQTRRAHVNPEFPSWAFDLEAMAVSPLKIKYTLAELDEFARAGPSERFVGYMSVLVTGLSLVRLRRRNMLMCNECCGLPIYANAVSATCEQCGKVVDLGVNPHVLGPLIDETGSTTCGQVIVSSQAWQHLFGRHPRDLVKLSCDALGTLEQRLLYLRVTLLFGWIAEEVGGGMGRLCVWEILS